MAASKIGESESGDDFLFRGLSDWFVSSDNCAASVSENSGVSANWVASGVSAITTGVSRGCMLLADWLVICGVQK